MFSSLKVKEFRIYWIGSFISLIGTWVQTVAQSWLVFELTKSAFLLGLVAFLGAMPIFFLSLFAGVAADRINKRNILILTQSAFMILAFLLAALTQAKLITPTQIMVIAVLNGIVMAFDMPSRHAIVIELVGKKQLLNAIALNSAAFNLSRIIGPAVAGMLVAGIGMAACFYLNGASFLAVILALFCIKVRGRARINNNSALHDIKDGLRMIKNNRLIMILVSMVGVVSLFGISYAILMPIIAQEVLHVGAKGLGMLMSASGLGALASTLALARFGDFRYKGKILLLSFLIFSASLIMLSLSRTYILSLTSMIFVGAAGVTATALINTLLQTMVQDEYRGRVMSAFMLTFAGIMPFGNLLAGVISQAVNVSFAVMFNGIACALFFVIINIFYPEIRDI